MIIDLIVYIDYSVMLIKYIDKSLDEQIIFYVL